MEINKTRQYFPGGNTSKGFYSLWNDNIDDLQKLIILKGGPGTGKSSLMTEIADKLQSRGYAVELLWCSSDAASLDGVIVREISFGIIDGTAPHLRDPMYPGVIDKIINLGDCWQQAQLAKNKEAIIRLTDLNRKLFKSTYKKLALAKKYHDELEQLHTEGMNWQAVDKMSSDVIGYLFNSFPNKRGRKIRRRFAGAITPQGPVNYFNELLNLANTRYILKGRAGTGKSTFLRKIANSALKKGFTVEIYHCSFDPLSIDSIYIPQLDLCFIDGTPPHEIEPGPNDRVLDMFQYMNGSIYRKNLDKIKTANEKYQQAFQESFIILKECKEIHDYLEKYYIEAMDFSAVDKLKENIFNEVISYANKH